MWQKIFKSILKFIIRLSLVVFFVWAIFLIILRQALPLISSHKVDIEKQITVQTGLVASIHKIETSWQGFGPQIDFLGIDLKAPKTNEKLFSIPKVSLQPSWWKSLLAWQVRTDIEVIGLDLHFVQDENKQWQVQELRSLKESDPATQEQTLRFVLSQPKWRLHQSKISLQGEYIKPTVLQDLSIIYEQHWQQQSAEIKWQASDGGKIFKTQLQWSGDVLYGWRNTLMIYADIPVYDWHTLWKLPDDGDYHLLKLRAGGEFWLNFYDKKLQKIMAKPRVVHLLMNGASQKVEVNNTQGLFLYERRKDMSTAVSVAEWQGRLNGIKWPFQNLAVKLSPDNKIQSLAAKNIVIDDAVLLEQKMLSLLPLNFRYQSNVEQLQRLNPKGLLSHFSLDMNNDQLVSLLGNFENAQWNPLLGIPGVVNLSGNVMWQPDRIQLNIASKKAQVKIPDMFAEPIDLINITGALTAKKTSDDWALSSNIWQLENQDALANAKFSVVIPHLDPAAARLSLSAGLSNGVLSSAWRYIPNPITAQWLKKGLTSGQASRADIIYEGPINHRPDLGYDQFLLKFKINNADLVFDPAWPAIHHLNGDLILNNNQLTMQAEPFKWATGISLTQVFAEIPDLNQAQINLTGNIETQAESLWRFFAESPLQVETKSLRKYVQMTGPLQGSMTLQVPLSEDAHVSVQANAHLLNNTINLATINVPIKEVQGHLFFDSQKGLSIDSLKGTLWKEPIQATIESQWNKEGWQSMVVKAAGVVGVPALKQWHELSVMQWLKGQAHYQANVFLPILSNKHGSFSIGSDLQGIQVTLPKPFTKKMNEKSNFLYQSELADGKYKSQLHYGNHLKAGMVWNEGQLFSTLWRIGSTSVAWLPDAGMELEARLSSAELATWLPYWQAFNKETTNKEPVNKETTSQQASTTHTDSPEFLRAELHVNDLVLSDWIFKNAKILAERKDKEWQIAFDSKELDGSLNWPDQINQPMRASIQKMQWPLVSTEMAQKVSKDKKSELPDVLAWHDRPWLVDISGIQYPSYPVLQSLNFNGDLQFNSKQLSVHKMQIKGPIITGDLTAQWQLAQAENTQIKTNLTISDAESFWHQMLWTPLVRSKNLTTNIQIQWPGSPGMYALDKVSGNVTVSIRNGRFLDVDTKASASRIFGWLDFKNLFRRLKGDFSDLGKGIAFDWFALSSPITQGELSQTVLEMKGPSMKANGKGKINLVQQTSDLDVNLILPVTGTAPIAAAVIGGPLIGGAVAAMQSAFSKQIDKVTERHYKITGSWDKPSVELKEKR